MAFLSSLKFLAKLDETPLINSVSSNTLAVIGSSTVTILGDGLGYVMNRDQYIEENSISLGISDKMTVGFWLKPTNPGQVRNPATELLEPLKISVLDIIEPNADRVLIVHEVTQSNGKHNKLVATLFGAAGGNREITSTTYTADNWHHFWLVYNGSTADFKLFLDGTEDTVIASGSVPDTINGTTASIAINRLALTPQYDVLNSVGTIDDVVILNDAITSSDTIKKAINNSIDVAFDTIYLNNEEVDQAFLFNDPDAFRLTSVVNDGTSIYAARSDGKILEGSQLIWQARRRFNNGEEIQDLDSFGGGFVLSKGFMQVNGVAMFQI